MWLILTPAPYVIHSLCVTGHVDLWITSATPCLWRVDLDSTDWIHSCGQHPLLIVDNLAAPVNGPEYEWKQYNLCADNMTWIGFMHAM